MDTKQSSEKRFALLIDADNVSAKYIKPITDELSKYGTVTYKRIYGDWTSTLHAKWKDALLENSITPIQQFSYTQGKNATDSAMIIDAMDILYTNSVEGFCIVSSDSDFTRLASRIRESGLTVVGMGEKKTPIPFRKACDIFTTLELLLDETANRAGRGKGHRAQSGESTGPSIERVEQAVVNIITDNQNNGKSTGLGEVGSRLLKRYPDFDVRSYGINQLAKLLDGFERVEIIKDGNSVEVVLAERAEAPAGKPEKPEKAKRVQRAAHDDQPEKTGSPERAERVDEAAPIEQGAPAEAEEAPQPVAADQQTVRKASRRNRRGNGRRARATVAEQQHGAASEQGSAVEADAAAVHPSDEAPAPQVDESAQPEPTDADTPERLIRQLVREAGAEGIALGDITKRVRAKHRSFKVRDHGFAQMRAYVASLDDIEVEKRGRDYVARLAD